MLIDFEIQQTWLTVVTLQNKWLVREYTSKQHHHPYNLVNTMSPAKSSDRSCLHSISVLYLGTHRAFSMSSHFAQGSPSLHSMQRVCPTAQLYPAPILSYFMQNMMT